MTIHRFYVPPEQIQGSRLALIGDSAGQIRRVLRLQPGAVIEAFDGTGRRILARIALISPQEVVADFVEVTFPNAEAPFPVLLLQALLKGEKNDWVAEKATELGVAEICFFPARRSVPQLKDDRSARKLERWRRIATEAAEQCGRVRLPAVRYFPSLKETLENHGDARFRLADEARAKSEYLGELEEPQTESERYSTGRVLSEPLVNPRASLQQPVAVLIGPEGGWTEEERLLAYRRGAEGFSLGPRILRAETAAIVALARLTF
jgi:16S rRNA (uracil1498-N3)-methyltransferase